MVVKAERIQWPVGQGCFSTGHIEIDGNYFDYVYDCGSTNVSALRTCIAAYRQKRSIIDALFISHLDNDHVNGIDLLTTSQDFRVGAVYLPFISEIEAVYLLTAELEKGALSTNFIEFLSDPVQWFGRRGIEHLIFVQPSKIPNDDESFGPESGSDQIFDRPVDGPNQNKGRLEARFSEPLIDYKPGEWSGCETRLLRPECDIGIGLSSRVGWILAPFVPPIEGKKFADFSSYVRSIDVFNAKGEIDHDKLLDLIKDKKKCKALKQAYRKLGINHNRISMCLYSGPQSEQNNDYHYIHNQSLKRHFYWHRFHKSGWMGTGDSMFGVKKVRLSFEKKFKRYLKNIGTLMCPHHGASQSFHKELLQLTNPEMCFASYGLLNSYRHPHKTVIEQIIFHKSEFHHVTDDVESMLTETIGLW